MLFWDMLFSYYPSTKPLTSQGKCLWDGLLICSVPEGQTAHQSGALAECMSNFQKPLVPEECSRLTVTPLPWRFKNWFFFLHWDSTRDTTSVLVSILMNSYPKGQLMTTNKKAILYHRKVRNFVLGSERNGREDFQLGKMGLLLSFMDIQSSMYILLVLYHSHDLVIS